MLLIGVILGGLAGAAFFGLAGTIAGMLVGGVIGGLIQFSGARRTPDLEGRVAALEARLAGVEKALYRLVDAPPVAASPADSATAASVATAAMQTAAPTGPAAPAPGNALWRWITGGNVLARVGAVVLFIGVAFLARYAVEHVSVPLELRLAGIALLGLALLVLGWRLRHSRRGYALTLQGTGIGVLYVTVFAAFALYHLLPPALAFFLLAAFVAEAGILAVRQDAPALAVLGTLGGFAAPVLISTGAGDHVALFTFYAVLDAGIFAIAWFRPWRALNLLGFACTFVVATAWGVLRYRPEDFATTEPFLVLFFLFYVGIAVAYALRRSLEVRAPIDATLVFGTPLVAAGLQAALMRPYEYGMATSAVVMAVVYIGLAHFIAARRRDGLRLLVEAFAALGLVFATLAIPLAVDARWTSATWALEGAAIAWVGLRQGRIALRTFGLLLQVAAAFAYLRGVELAWTTTIPEATPLLDSRFVGSLLIALAGIFTAWRYDAEPQARRPVESVVAPAMLAWGLAWWLAGGAAEIERFAPRADAAAWLVAWLGVTTALLLAAGRALRFALARTPAVAVVPVLLVIALVEAARLAGTDDHLLRAWHAIPWIGAIGVGLAALRTLEREARVRTALLAVAQAALVWLAFVLVTESCAWLVRAASERNTWRVASWLLVPSMLAVALCSWHAPQRWPFDRWRAIHVQAGVGVVVVALVVVALLVNFASDGNPAPLPYVPIVNPLDVTFATVALAAILWGRELRAIRGAPVIDARAIAVAGALSGLAWITMSTVRVVHHMTDVPFRLHAAWQSDTVQTALALVWTVLAIAAMVVANRRHSRTAWVGGASLLAVVVAKLLFVDFANTGTVARIVSFMGVGLLLLLVGYLAPLPPRPAGDPA